MPQQLPEGFELDQSPNIGAPIDLNRPKLNNADGTFSTEETITIESNGRFHNIPTIVDGRRVSEDDAIALFNSRVNNSVGDFATLKEALLSAQARTQEIGRTRLPPGFELDEKSDVRSKFGLEGRDLSRLGGEERRELIRSGVPVAGIPASGSILERGLTLGGIDELQGAAAAGAQFVSNRAGDVRAAVTGGEIDPNRPTAGEKFSDTQALSELEAKQFGERAPVRNIAGQFAGGLALGGPAASGAVKGATTLLGAAARGARTAAPFGGAAGALSEGDLGERAGKAITGAAVAGAIGFGLPFVATGVSNFLARRAGKTKAPQIDVKAFRVIRNRLARDLGGKSKAEAALRKWRANGSKAEDLLDLGGENMRVFLTEIASENPEAALQMANKFKTAQAATLKGGVRRLIKGVDPKDTIDAVIVAKNVKSGPAYKRAYDFEIPIDVYNRELRELMAIDGVRAGANRATKLLAGDIAEAANRGDRASVAALRGTKQLVDNWRGGNREVVLDTRSIDYITRGLRSMERSQRRSAPDVARATGNVARVIRDRLKSINDDFAQATKIFSDSARAEDAFNLGSEVFKKPSRKVVEEVAEMSAGDLEMYQLGIGDAIEQKLLLTRDKGNKASFLTSEDLRQRLKAAFKEDDNAIRAFIEFVKLSERRFERVGVIQRAAGSQTQPRIEGAKAVRGEIRNAVRRPQTALKQSFENIVDAPFTASEKKVSEALSELLFEGRQSAAPPIAPFDTRPAALTAPLTPGLAASGG